jgi:hypothetical protein
MARTLLTSKLSNFESISFFAYILFTLFICYYYFTCFSKNAVSSAFSFSCGLFGVSNSLLSAVWFWCALSRLISSTFCCSFRFEVVVTTLILWVSTYLAGEVRWRIVSLVLLGLSAAACCFF